MVWFFLLYFTTKTHTHKSSREECTHKKRRTGVADRGVYDTIDDKTGRGTSQPSHPPTQERAFLYDCNLVMPWSFTV